MVLQYYYILWRWSYKDEAIKMKHADSIQEEDHNMRPSCNKSIWKILVVPVLLRPPLITASIWCNIHKNPHQLDAGNTKLVHRVVPHTTTCDHYLMKASKCHQGMDPSDREQHRGKKKKKKRWKEGHETRYEILGLVQTLFGRLNAMATEHWFMRPISSSREPCIKEPS